MLGLQRVEPLFGLFLRMVAAASVTRAGAPAMVLVVAFALAGSMHTVSLGPDEDEALVQLDAHDQRALGLGSVHRHRAAAGAAAATGDTRAHPGQERAITVRRLPVLDTEQQNIARFIARRYQVAIEQTQYFVEYAYRTAREFKVDPWLILAVISVESSFDPKAESHQGAQGLMQVLTRVHVDKFAPFGGAAAAFDPLANIKVGAQILKEYMGRDGTVEGALKAYVGAALLPHDGGYGAKVLGERERIAAAAKGHPDPARQPTRQASVDAAARGGLSPARDI
jgi:soluble lytic murein transglycosylase-like protein